MMEISRNFSKVLGSALAAFGVLLGTGSSSIAADFDWTYAVDSFDDSITGNIVGGTKYEIYSSAYKYTKDKIFWAVNLNFPLSGSPSDPPTDGHVGYGDLIFQFGDGSRYGVRIVDNNDSGVSSTGIFKDIQIHSLASQNGLLLANLAAYNTWVSDNGGTPSLGDLPANTSFFDQSQHVPGTIAQGTKIGDFSFLSPQALAQEGLDFSSVNATGTYTVGLSWDKALFPNDDFVYWFGPECDNDLIAGIGEFTEIPESSLSSIGLVLLGLIGITKIRKR